MICASSATLPGTGGSWHTYVAYSAASTVLIITVLQAFGMVQLKKPHVYSSRLHTWRAQALAQCLGVNYIMYRIMSEQPMGQGIPVLLTSFEDKQAIVFCGQSDHDQDSISETVFDSAADAINTFKEMVSARQCVAIKTIDYATLRDNVRASASAATRLARIDEHPTDTSAAPHDPNELGKPSLSVRARFELAQAGYLASLQTSTNPLARHADLSNLAIWLPKVEAILETLSGGKCHLPEELRDIMQEELGSQR